MSFIRPCFDANNILQLNNSGWAINGTIVTATAAQINAAGAIPANAFQIYVSALFGNDLNNGSFSAPLATLGAALTLAGSPSPGAPVVIILFDSSSYDEAVVIAASVENLFIFGPTASINFSGTGDALTVNASAKLFIYIATVTNSGTGNAITNNGGEVLGYIDVIQSATNAIDNVSGAVIIQSSLAIEGNILLSSGNVIYNTLLRQSGTDAAGVVGTNALGTSGPWSVAANLEVSGLSNDNIGGTCTSSIISGSISSGSLSGAGSVSLLPVNNPSAQYQIIGITINGVSGTNFSGIGGDRNISITDGTNTWSTISAASLAAFAGTNYQWDSVTLPLPTAIDLSQLTQPGQQLQALYSGGTTDYTAGAFSINLQYARIV